MKFILFRTTWPFCFNGTGFVFPILKQAKLNLKTTKS